jgi:2-polyprenyl-3-methyl-5-hydroxy-6-metoxy-1,4-benzoquinol methylase
LDSPDIPEHVRELCYRDLTRVHQWLGNLGVIVRRIQGDPLPVRRVLDIGCAHGLVLQHIHQRLGVEVIGADLNPPARQESIPIVRCDAITDPLPPADIAISLMMAHHLSSGELRELIRNVGRSCRRLLILDLVRRSAAMTLFRTFVAPFVSPINVEDGLRSFARAFTPLELTTIVQQALADSASTFRHDVAPFGIRQVVDIRYDPGQPG